MKQKTFYVTTPIYYPSGNLHIGHLYTTTLAWTLRNYKQMMGYDAKFLTGSDEHGQKIAQKAQQAKMSEIDFVNMQVAKFVELWKKSEIDYDYFSRTTASQHKQVVKNVFNQMLEKGYIYKGQYKGLYSVDDEEFLTLTQAKFQDGKYFHPTSGHPLVEIAEESYFFKMNQFQQWWKDTIVPNTNLILPNKIVKELEKNFVDKGLEELSITRISFEWGIKIDKDPKHVVYVWLDALFNYLSALGYSLENDKDYQKYWENGDQRVHIIGKEIARFHCIYWPIMLHSLNIKLPTTIISHGWLITPEGKMSKSKGNVVDPLKLLEKFHPEVIKYFFVSQISIGSDGTFDEALLKNVYNADLANNYGNLLSRTIAMVSQSFSNGIVKYHPEKLEDLDKQIYQSLEKTTKEYTTLFDEFKVDKAFKTLIQFSSELNAYIDQTTPWLLKDNLARLEVVLNTILNGIYTLTTLLSPVMPNKAKQALKQLNISALKFDLIKDYHKFDKVGVIKQEPLFERLK